MTPEQWLARCLFLESIAGVPGMVAGMLRHLRSLRLMVSPVRDYMNPDLCEMELIPGGLTWGWEW